MLGSKVWSPDRKKGGSQAQRERDVKMHYMLQKIYPVHENGRRYLYRDLHYIIPKMPLPAHNIRRIFRAFGHFRRLEYTNWLLLQNHASHVISWVTFNLVPSRTLELDLRAKSSWPQSSCTTIFPCSKKENSEESSCSWAAFSCSKVLKLLRNLCPPVHFLLQGREGRKAPPKRAISVIESRSRPLVHLRSDLQPSAVPSWRWRSPTVNSKCFGGGRGVAL